MKTSKLFIGIMTIAFFIIVASARPVSAQAQTGDYHTLFDATYYYQTYADVAEAFGRDEKVLYAHFVNYGIYEGRSGSAEFDVDAYRTRYPDLNESFGDSLVSYYRHYISFGRAEGRIATADGQPYNGTALKSAACTNSSSKAGQSGKKSGKELDAYTVTKECNSSVSAKTTIESATKSAPQGEGVTGTYTSYYDESEARATNVKLAAQRVNGVVIQPGESFSFSNTVLPRTAENGYVVAPVISNGKMSEGMGGGICQVSSTLYAAMLTAGIPVTERYAHSLPMDYVPRGMDATIAGNTKDLKFKNIYEKPLVISANAADGKLVVTIGLQE